MTVTEYRFDRGDDYRLVRVKRGWVPEWLFFWCNAFGAVAWFPPLRWLVTRKVDDAGEPK